jgi:integrase
MPHGAVSSRRIRCASWRGERPSVGRREQRILDRDEIAKLLDSAPRSYRTLLATAIFTALRQGELLGLTWQDMDFDAGLVRVRKSLDRSGNRTEPKTSQAVREVLLMPALGRMLREHKLASPYSAASDFVFASQAGTPLNWRNASKRGLEKAVENAKLGGGRVRFPDLRHTFASLLTRKAGTWSSSRGNSATRRRTSRSASTRTCSTAPSTRSVRATRFKPLSGVFSTTTLSRVRSWRTTSSTSRSVELRRDRSERKRCFYSKRSFGGLARRPQTGATLRPAISS